MLQPLSAIQPLRLFSGSITIPIMGPFICYRAFSPCSGALIREAPIFIRHRPYPRRGKVCNVEAPGVESSVVYIIAILMLTIVCFNIWRCSGTGIGRALLGLQVFPL